MIKTNVMKKLSVFCLLILYCFALKPYIVRFFKLYDPFCIEVFSEVSYCDTLEINKAIYRSDYYLVSGFYANEVDYQRIDEFVCKNLDTNIMKGCQDYSMIFYKKTKNTNNVNIKQNPKDFDRFSDYDKICEYKWYDGAFDRKEVRTGEYPLFNIYKDYPCK